MNNNPVSWFEIPVSDMKRAVRFYETVFDFKLTLQVFGQLEMAWFPGSENGRGSNGSLVLHKDFYKPSHDGTLIYFTSPSGDVVNEEKKVEKAGGKILFHKKLISENFGYMSVVLDSEGNRIAVHSGA
jgi:uncharacterized protein